MLSRSTIYGPLGNTLVLLARDDMEVLMLTTETHGG